MSVESLLDHFAVLKGITERRARKEVVEALLRKTNQWDVRKQKLGGYSGGIPGSLVCTPCSWITWKQRTTSGR